VAPCNAANRAGLRPQGEAMLAGDFERKLQKLNKDLKIFCGNDDSKPAGIFHVVNGEYTEICGIDKGYVSEYSFVRSDGIIIRSGWRRALKILLGKGLISRYKAERIFNTYLGYSQKRKPIPTKKETVSSFGLPVMERGAFQ